MTTDLTAPPARPGPGLLAALGWTAVLAAVNLGTGFALVHGAAWFGYEVEFVWRLAVVKAVEFAMAVGIVVFCYGPASRRILALRGLHVRQGVLTVLLLPPLLVVAVECRALAEELLCWLDLMPEREVTMTVLRATAATPWLVGLVAVAVLPALGEETFFRGFIGRGLVGRLGVLAGVLLTALLFAAIHLNPLQGAAAFVFGLGLHAVLLSTKSLLAPLLLHLLLNGLIFMLFRSSGPAPAPAGEAAPAAAEVVRHLSPLLVGSALIVLAAVGMLLYETRTRWLLPDGRPWEPGSLTPEMPPPELHASPHSGTPRPRTMILGMAAYLLFGFILVRGG
jgi:membrane protease YdiL (CAAX protease family)